MPLMIRRQLPIQQILKSEDVGTVSVSPIEITRQGKDVVRSLMGRLTDHLSVSAMSVSLRMGEATVTVTSDNKAVIIITVTQRKNGRDMPLGKLEIPHP